MEGRFGKHKSLMTLTDDTQTNNNKNLNSLIVKVGHL